MFQNCHLLRDCIRNRIRRSRNHNSRDIIHHHRVCARRSLVLRLRLCHGYRLRDSQRLRLGTRACLRLDVQVAAAKGGRPEDLDDRQRRVVVARLEVSRVMLDRGRGGRGD